MISIQERVSVITVITDDMDSATALADRMEQLRYSVHEIRFSKHTGIATIIVADPNKLGVKYLKLMIDTHINK